MVLVFCSCQSNAFYFDIQEQSIVSINSKGIRRIHIYNDSTNEKYLFLWESTVSSAPTKVNLLNINEGYMIYEDWFEKPINRNKFKFKPSSRYTIERLQGDAGGYKIRVWTDEKAVVNKAL